MKATGHAAFTVILALCASMSAQSPSKPSPPSDAQKSFELLKSLAGNWQGAVTVDNPAMKTDTPLSLSIQVASRGNALVHQLSTPGPEVTVFYVENDRLTLVHYCDFANRPLMVARPLPDGKRVEFDLAGVTGSDQFGHVTHWVMNVVDANHHTEDWEFVPPGGKAIHAHVDFTRVP